MAKDNIEIEIKIPVSLKTFKRVKSYLSKNAKLVKKSQEIDKYFNSPSRDFLKPKHPYEYLRLRCRKGCNSFDYKKIFFDKNGKKTHADEFETHIENCNSLEKILSALDFKNFISIDKHRETYKIGNSFEVELDTVKGLGYFVEVESLKDFGGKELTYNNVVKIIKKLELDMKKEDNSGYVLLFMRKKGLIK